MPAFRRPRAASANYQAERPWSNRSPADQTESETRADTEWSEVRKRRHLAHLADNTPRPLGNANGSGKTVVTMQRRFDGPGSQGFVRKAFACLAEVRGTDRVPIVSPDYARRRSNRAARLLVSSRPASPLLTAFRNNGLVFTEVNPTQPVAGFTPPTALAETSSRKS